MAKRASIRFRAIADRFTSREDVEAAIRQEGLEKACLIFGIDFTMSNKVQGDHSCQGRNLHEIADDWLNPYQQVIAVLGATLESFDDDGIIPTFGFGDKDHKDEGIFPLKGQGNCMGFRDVLETYKRITPDVKLHRPTNFAPLIYKALEIVQMKGGKYHILVIVADGQVTNEADTVQAIVTASEYPLSIIVIGVGDGPWGMMEAFDDRLPDRQFDNFQFVNFHEVMSKAKHPEAEFALHALMEIPDQYRILKSKGLIN